MVSETENSAEKRRRVSLEDAVVPADYSGIRQSKVVTFASYRLGKMHSDILIHVREELQKYLCKDIGGLPEKGLCVTVPLFVKDYPHCKGNVVVLHEKVRQMFTMSGNVIDFSWRYSEAIRPVLERLFVLDDVRGRRKPLYKEGDVVHTSSVIITDVNYIEGRSDVVLAYINPRAVPFLLYCGSGIGGTQFNRDVALSLHGVYAKRIYEMLCDWGTSKSVVNVPVSEMRKMFLLSDKYRNVDICRRILEPAKQEISASKSNYLFDYQMVYDPEYGMDASAGKKRANVVRFSIVKKEGVNLKDLSYKTLVLYLKEVADDEKAHLCEPLASQVVDNGQDWKLKSKFEFYYRKCQSGKMSKDAFRNTLLKIIRETTGVDLRSDTHIRNARLYERKTSVRTLSGSDAFGGETGFLF